MKRQPRPLLAAYATECSACGEPIAPGDPLAKRHGEHVHARCYAGGRDDT